MDENEKYYSLYKKHRSFVQMRTLFLSTAKNDSNLSFIFNVNSRVWRQAIGDANQAYEKFFNKVCNLPKKRTKKDEKQTFSTERFTIKSNKSFRISGANVIGSGKRVGYIIKTAENISFLKDLNVYRVTISYDKVNYYVSFDYKILKIDFYKNYENQIRFYYPRKQIVGIDLGLKTYVVQSDGKVAIFPKKKILKLEKKIRKVQSIMSKKYNKTKKPWEQSKNYYRMKTKFNKLQKRKTNITNDFLDKYTTWLVTHYQVIKIEDLKIKNMIKNHKLAKAISRCCFYRFRCMLDYKCKLYGSQLIIIDQFYPSSKLCYCCGNKKQKLSLGERKYICEKCGHEMDRDYNAALNIMEWTEGKNIKNKAN